MKKLSLLLVTVILGSMLAACGGSADAALTVQIGPNPETLDPALNSASDGASMIVHTFENLLTYDQNEQLQPGQAAEMPTVSNDGLVYTFKLREGLKWSDGSPLTATDFEYSWKRTVAAETAAPYAELMSVIAGFEEANAGDGSALQVKAVDETTLEVTLANPCAYFTELVAHPTFAPVQKATVDKNGDKWATQPKTYIGNGAFQVSKWVPSEYILFTKNNNYWDADNITLESIKFLLIEDANASLSAYENGTALLVKDMPANEIPSLRDREDFRLDPMQGTYYLSFNTQKAPFDDARVRKALSIALDRDYIANTVMQGTYTLATSFIGPGVPDAEPGSEFMKVSESLNGGEVLIDSKPNIEEAKALLAEAGFDESNPLKFAYSTNDSAYHVAVAEAMQQMWKEVGVEMTIDIMEWASFTPARRNGDFEVARNGWINDYGDPSTMLDLLVGSNGNNDGKYSNPEYDKLMEDAAATDDQSVRMPLMHEAEMLALEDAAMAPIAYYSEFYLISPKLQGFYHSSLGYFYFMHCTVTE